MSWIIKASSKIDFTANAQVKVTIGISDLEKQPEIERLKASDMPTDKKVAAVQEVVAKVYSQAISDKLRGINEYALSQGVIISNVGEAQGDGGEIDWQSYFQKYEHTRPQVNKGDNNESKEAPQV